MRTTQIINQLLKLEDEFKQLEDDNKMLTRILKTEDKEELSHIEKAFIELGKQQLMKECLSYDAKYDLKYGEKGINRTFEQWADNAIDNRYIPDNLSLDTVKTALKEPMEQYYKTLAQNAQLEYARSKKES